jgi:hypothetical protein
MSKVQIKRLPFHLQNPETVETISYAGADWITAESDVPKIRSYNRLLVV